MPHHPDRLTKKLILSLLAFSSVVTLTVTVIQLVLDYQRDITTIESALDNLETSHLPSLARAVWGADNLMIEAILAGVTAHKDLSYAAITGPGNLSHINGDRLTVKVIERSWPIRYMYKDMVRELGTLVVQADLRTVYDRLIDRFLVILISQGAKTFLTTTFLYFLIHFLVIRHILSLSYQARNIVPYTRPSISLNRPRTHSNKQDELDLLEQAIAQMIMELYTSHQNMEKTVEKRTKELQDEITIRKKTEKILDGKAEKLKQANAELRQFTYFVSHDLKTPLRAIYIYATMIREELNKNSISPEVSENIAQLFASVDHSRRLIDDLLTLSRIGKNDMECSAINLDAVLTEVIKELTLPEDAHIAIAPNLPVVYSNTGLLHQVFTNLITNGLKFNTSDLKTVSINSTRTAKDSVEIAVHDNGIGIAPEHHETIFAPFQRLHPTSRYQGTGIGLAIVKKALEAMGGSIRLESRPGKGTSFYVTLPTQGRIGPDN